MDVITEVITMASSQRAQEALQERWWERLNFNLQDIEDLGQERT
jgi:hypothetical protein